MTLSEYLRATGTTREGFAAKVEAHPVTVSKWCSGAMLPTRRFMARIVAATKGEVTVADLANVAATPTVRPRRPTPSPDLAA